MTRIVGMSFSMRFDAAIPEDAVEEASRVEFWPPGLAESFPVVNHVNGVVSGMTRVERIDVHEDRMGVTFHLAMGDTLADPDDRVTIPEEWTP